MPLTTAGAWLEVAPSSPKEAVAAEPLLSRRSRASCSRFSASRCTAVAPSPSRNRRSACSCCCNSSAPAAYSSPASRNLRRASSSSTSSFSTSAAAAAVAAVAATPPGPTTPSPVMLPTDVAGASIVTSGPCLAPSAAGPTIAPSATRATSRHAATAHSALIRPSGGISCSRSVVCGLNMETSAWKHANCKPAIFDT
ncbi:hypothetical protein Vafri_431 [Volvox africanus]|nr:hypothetical protein Vafri_431 [Volvox africanus]